MTPADSSDNQEQEPRHDDLPSPDDILRQHDVTPERGLSNSEVRARREQHGSNSLEEEHDNPVLRLLKHF